MGISLDITKDTWGVDNLDWLAIRKGFDTCRPGTVDISLFTVDHYPNGFIPSGTVLAAVTATGRLGPYSPLLSNGLQTPVGHMLQPVTVKDRMGNAKTRAAVAFRWEGVVLLSKLPNFINTANLLGEVDAAAQTALKFIRYEP